MSLRIVLAATAALVLSTPSFAQEALRPAPPPAATPPATEEEMSPEMQALVPEVRGFEEMLVSMGQEIRTAITAAGADTAKANSDSDAIIAGYQPRIDAFAAKVEAVAATEAAALTDETARAEKRAEGAEAVTVLRGIGQTVKAQVIEAMAATPATPPAP